jgi:hypothetical protein
MVDLSIAIKDESPGTEIVCAILNSVDDLKMLTVISVAVAPSIFEITKLFTFKIVFELFAFAIIFVGVVVTARTAVLPKMLVTPTMFGFAMPYPPNTIAIAMTFPTLCSGPVGP